MSKDEFVESLRAIIEYMWTDEERNYEECETGLRDNHIFTHLKRVEQWLKAQEQHD